MTAIIDVEKETVELDYEVKIQVAQQYYIKSRKHSWAIFMVSEVGDLMINSDWGICNFGWRSFGGSFKEFLVGLEESYWKGKMEYNLNNYGVPKKFQKRTVDNVYHLFAILQTVLKEEIANSKSFKPENHAS